MNTPFLTVSHLTYAYPPAEGQASVPVLRDLSFSVERGSFVTVLGQNGSGKSTLAKLLNGILLPTEGTVTVDGIDSADEEKTYELRRKIGMVFQNPDNQLVSSIVEEDVAFGPENLGLQPAEIRRRVDDALTRVGMADAAERAPHTLSGGQKQRIAIAGVLALSPECIVFDESTAMLDPRGRREIMDTILDLNRNSGMTVILITHLMDEAAQSDRVIVINEGVIAMDGKPETVFSDVEALWKLGLDVPETAELWHLLSCHPELELPALSREEMLSEDAVADALRALLRGGKNA